MGTNAGLALAAAAMWGSGDFTGGMGVRRAGGSLVAALRVVLLSHASSLCGLLVIAWAIGNAPPRGWAIGWALAAGVAGGLAVVLFYLALARGAMGASAALSGLLAAAIPALVSAVLDGFPGWRRLVGFSVAGLAIWLIAAGPAGVRARGMGTTVLAIAAGAGFGVYFICLKFAGAQGVVWPMTVARLGSLSVCAGMLGVIAARGREPEAVLPRAAIGFALATAALDTSGNLLFIAATRAGRLDVAAVLASLYPAMTILLAAWALREAPTPRQGLGMGVAIAAIALIAL